VSNCLTIAWVMEESYPLGVTFNILLKLNTYEPFKETLAVGTDFASVLLDLCQGGHYGKDKNPNNYCY
jgi:hypothetical protein